MERRDVSVSGLGTTSLLTAEISRYDSRDNRDEADTNNEVLVLTCYLLFEIVTFESLPLNRAKTANRA